MRLATWNINSVRLRIDLVTGFLRDHDIDVLCLQKAFAKQEAALEENHRLKEELHWLKVENSGLKQTNSWWSKAAQK